MERKNVMDSILQIDGSYGEGGGQILRTSLSLSVLTERPIEIIRIRAGRSRPGLMPQHLAAVKAAAAISAAQTDGAEVGSGRVRFVPQSRAAPGDYHFAIGTAGAATLVAQTVLLPLALADGPSRVTITGGTHVPFAPTADYLEYVYLAALRRYGLVVTLSSPTAGFFPKGGGKIVLAIMPCPCLNSATVTQRGELRTVTARIVTTGLPATVGERGAAAVRAAFAGKIGECLTTETRQIASPGQGAAITIVADCDGGPVGFSAIGERGKRIERIAAAACTDFEAWRETGAACDEHLADQLVLPLALTQGESRWATSRVAEHLRSILWLVPQFLPRKITLSENEDGSGVIALMQDSLEKTDGLWGNIR